MCANFVLIVASLLKKKKKKRGGGEGGEGVTQKMYASFVLTVSSLLEKGMGVGGYPKNVRKHCINRFSVA